MIDLVVNAGGASRRMGRTKALLPVPPDDIPLIDYVVRRLLPLVTGEVVIVTEAALVAKAVRAAPTARIVADAWQDGGALGGLATGLANCSGWAMVVACDMPLVSPAIMAQLIARSATTDAHAVIPHIAGRAQPFHALWHRRAEPRLAAQLAAGDLAIYHALAHLSVCWMGAEELGIAPDDGAFTNINTPEEWTTLLNVLADENRPTAQ